MNWKIGDRCIIDCPGSRVHGQETTIVSIDERGHCWRDGDFIGAGVDIHHETWSSGHGVFEYKNLRPIPDDNSRKLVKWSECPFKPKELISVLA